LWDRPGWTFHSLHGNNQLQEGDSWLEDNSSRTTTATATTAVTMKTTDDNDDANDNDKDNDDKSIDDDDGDDDDSSDAVVVVVCKNDDDVHRCLRREPQWCSFTLHPEMETLIVLTMGCSPKNIDALLVALSSNLHLSKLTMGTV